MSMGFDFRGYLEIARLLLQSEGEEQACFRASISRSYYACCNQAKEKSPYAHDTEGASHGRVIDFYIHHPTSPRLKDIGKDLQKLRRTRNRADYLSDAAFTRTQAENALKTAEAVIHSLEKI